MNGLWSKNKAIILFGTLVLAVVAPLSVVADWDGQCRSSNGGVCDRCRSSPIGTVSAGAAMAGCAITAGIAPVMVWIV